MISAKSLHQVNIAFVLAEGFARPDAAALTALYRGADAAGAQVWDDPFIPTTMVKLPGIGLKLVLEKNRFRIEDEQGREPEKSPLSVEAARIASVLFPAPAVQGYGFNFDWFFRFNNVISINDRFAQLFGRTLLDDHDLRDIGVQFTWEKQEYAETWFFKITAPLELAVHCNRHFRAALPSAQELLTQMSSCYNEADRVVESFERPPALLMQ